MSSDVYLAENKVAFYKEIFSVILLANLSCDESKVPKIDRSLGLLAKAADKRGQRPIFVASLLKESKNSDDDTVSVENLAKF